MIDTFDALEAWKSMMPGRICFSDKSLVSNWLHNLREPEFENPGGVLFGYEQRFEEIAEYWLRHGKHDSGRNDPNIADGQKMWDEYLLLFVKIEQEDYWRWC